ncbi:MAG: hypothetical protein IZT55_02055 [Anaerolineae bacterium]|nr:hypothetical protein [Anaerolineae bacterium]
MKLISSLIICTLFLFLLTSSCNVHTITITIVLPAKLTPYYQWILDFPIWRFDEGNSPAPPDPAPSRYKVNIAANSCPTLGTKLQVISSAYFIYPL